MILVCHLCSKTPAPDSVQSRLLKGDKYVQYTCSSCSPDYQAKLERLPMNWVSIIQLVLYHLHHTEPNDHGYCRWKEDICRVIETHWNELCPNRIQSGAWMNSISSILSANPSLFANGFATMNQSGWWALKEIVPPNLPEATADGRKRRGQVAVIEEVQEEQYQRHGLDEDDIVSGNEDIEVVTPVRKVARISSPQMPQLIPPVQIAPSPPAPIRITPVTPIKPFVPVVPVAPKPIQALTNQPSQPQLSQTIQAAQGIQNAEEIKRKLVERLLRVDSELLKAALTRDSSASKPLQPIMYVPNSQPTTSSSTQPQKKKVKPTNYVRASPHENELTDVTNRILNPDERIRRLKRKLAVRRIKRINGIPLFDIDNWIYLYLKAGNEPLNLVETSAPTLLAGLKHQFDSPSDPHQTSTAKAEESFILEGGTSMVQAELSDIPYLRDPSLSFYAKLMGVMNLPGYPFELESPYSGKILPKYVFRLSEYLPPRIALLKELRKHTDDDEGDDTVDVRHVRKEFLPQVNRILRSNFWPSIDVSESLEHPDYSLLLLYKKLVIGCAICSPEGYLSYLFVHPEWRSTGLASRMLYFLTNSLPEGRDLTVHVAVGNPAVMLYQKWGFKPEEFIVDFYSNRFRTADVDESVEPDPSMRNAFFLRLRR